MAGGLALKVELETPGALLPGATVHGRVLVRRSLRVQRLTVELRLIERTSSIRALRRGPKQVIAESTELAEGQSVAFSLSLPADAEATWSTGTAQLTWRVHARAEVRGIDHEAGTDLAVNAGPIEAMSQRGPVDQGSEAVPSGDSESGTADLVTAAERITARGQRTNELVGWGLSAVGAFIAVVGLTRLGAEDGGAPVLLGFGGVMTAVGIVIAAVHRRSAIGGVSIMTDHDRYSPGDRIKATATNDLGTALRIGYQIVEGAERAGTFHDGDRIRKKTESVTRILHAQWNDLPPGYHELDFAVPEDAIATSVGRAAAISHRIIVVEPGDEEKTMVRRAMVSPVLVAR